VRELIEGRGSSLLYLPPYSPDFSPIEETISKIKAMLKKSAARTRGALLEAIGRAISAVMFEDAVGYFGHYGYLSAAQPHSRHRRLEISVRCAANPDYNPFEIVGM
jgi:hypothetical protein